MNETLTLNKSDKTFSSVLENGAYQKDGKDYVAIAREILNFGPEKEKVIFELIPFEQLKRESFIKRWLRATRAYSLTASLGPFLALISYALMENLSFSPLTAFLALSGALFLQIAVNLFNDVSDYKKLLDLPGSPGGSGVLKEGQLSLKQLRRAGYLSLFFGMLFGAPVVFSNPYPLLLISLMAGAGAYFYSQEGFGLKYLGLGDITVFLLTGPLLTAGYAYALFSTIPPATHWLGVLFGLATWGLLHANNLRDIGVDSCRNLKTFATFLGFNRSRLLLPVTYSLFLALFLGGVLFGQLPKISLITLLPCFPVAFIAARKSLKAGGPDSPHLNQLRAQTAQFHVLFSLGFMLSCLGVSFSAP